MIGKPIYQKGDKVNFYINLNETKSGVIEIVDEYGVFENKTDVHYDILVEEENCLYKHIIQKNVWKVN